MWKSWKGITIIQDKVIMSYPIQVTPGPHLKSFYKPEWYTQSNKHAVSHSEKEEWDLSAVNLHSEI